VRFSRADSKPRKIATNKIGSGIAFAIAELPSGSRAING